MLKAWKARASYIPGGSSMKSWAFVILRNCFLSQMRRKKFTADYDELAAERLLVAPDNQADSLHLADRSEEHTSEPQSLMSRSYAVFCFKNKKQILYITNKLHQLNTLIQ